MRDEKKYVYSVTLNEPVAEELRRLDAKGKLSRGITRAQELLGLPNVLEYALAVEANQTEKFYAKFRSGLYKTAVRPSAMPAAAAPPEQSEHERIEQEAFARSQAAYDAGKPLPDHAELRAKGLGHVRQRVLERCETTFGWRYGPVPPGIVLPTDDVFGDTEPPRQGTQGDSRGIQGTAPDLDAEIEAIKSIEREGAAPPSSEGPIDSGTTAPAATLDEAARDAMGRAAAASTSDVTGTEPPETIAADVPGEPQF